MHNNHRFSDSERAAIYRAIAERRDMRHFLPDPVDPGERFHRGLSPQTGGGSSGSEIPPPEVDVADRDMDQHQRKGNPGVFHEAEAQATNRRHAGPA